MRRLIRIIRNLALLLIAAIAILAGVLAFNVVTHGSRQIQVAAVPRVAVDTQAAAARLSEAIRFRAISSYEKPGQHADALRGMQAHIEKSFPAFDARCELVAQYSLHLGRFGPQDLGPQDLGPQGAADHPAGASGCGAGGARHREGLAATAF
jgi:hypothetical protein